MTEWTKKIKVKGISMEKNLDFAWELITEHVAKAFLVSSDVTEKRMEKDGIKKSTANNGYRETISVKYRRFYTAYASIENPRGR